jgi:hypothetical protein
LVLDLICVILCSVIKKQQFIQKAGISTQSKNKVQNSPGSHAWSYMSVISLVVHCGMCIVMLTYLALECIQVLVNCSVFGALHWYLPLSFCCIQLIFM